MTDDEHVFDETDREILDRARDTSLGEITGGPVLDADATVTTGHHYTAFMRQVRAYVEDGTEPPEFSPAQLWLDRPNRRFGAQTHVSGSSTTGRAPSPASPSSSPPARAPTTCGATRPSHARCGACLWAAVTGPGGRNCRRSLAGSPCVDRRPPSRHACAPCRPVATPAPRRRYAASSGAAAIVTDWTTRSACLVSDAAPTSPSRSWMSWAFRSGNATSAEPSPGTASYLLPFARLCGTQSISQFASELFPPLDHGVTWSASISFIS